jgi:hypothetical protein
MTQYLAVKRTSLFQSSKVLFDKPMKKKIALIKKHFIGMRDAATG